MSRKVVKSRKAFADLEGIVDYLIEEAGARTAARFLEMAEESFEKLVRFPELGALAELENASLQDLRIWPVSRFANYLIFYRLTDEAIEIVRVVHAARDFSSLFPK